jgi:hypothetical protein
MALDLTGQEQTAAAIPTTQSTTEAPKQGKKPATNDERHSLLKSRLKIAQAWAKKPHETYKAYISEYDLEDLADPEEVRDRVRIGTIFRKAESDQAALFDDQPDLFIKGRQPNVESITPVITGVYDYLWDLEHLEERIEEAALYFKVAGLGFIHSPWVTKTKQVIDEATGQPYDVPLVDNPMAETLDIFKIFFSPETKFNYTLDYEHCPYLFIKRVMTPEEVESRFGVTVDTDEKLGFDDSKVEAEVAREVGDNVTDDLRRVTVWEYYGCLPEKMVRGLTDQQGQAVKWAYDKDYHLYFTSKEELKVEACPYETKPVLCVGNYGMANRFWKFGDSRHLLPLVRELEQYRTQILKHTRKMANPKLLYPMTNDPKTLEALRDPRVGREVPYDGASPPPSYLSPANLGREVEAGITQVRTDIEKEQGSFDLASGSNQSTVKTPVGIQVFSEAADKNIRRQRKKLARFIRELIVFQFKQLAVYWKPEDGKTIPVTDQSGAMEALQVTPEVLQLLDGVNLLYNLDIEIESLSVNRVQMRQDALELLDRALATPPGIVKLEEVWRDALQNGFSKKDGDRYLYTEEEKQALAQSAKEEPKVSVSIKADAATPPGAMLLEQSGLLPEGVAQQAVVDTAVMQQVTGEIQGEQAMEQQAAQGKQQLEGDVAKAELGNQHKQEQTFQQQALQGPPSNGTTS